MIALHVRLHASEGHAPEIEQLLLDLAEGSRSEPGNISYHIYRDLEEGKTFSVVEEYRDEDAFANHLATEHIAMYRSRLPLLVDGREVQKWHVVEDEKLD